MKTNLIMLVISTAIFAGMSLFSLEVFSTAPAYTRYYIAAVLMISGMLAIISLLRLLLTTHRRQPTAEPKPQNRSNQRREHYRLTFQSTTAPLFLQTTGDGFPDGAFSCPVRDVSETGLTLRCTGVYTSGQTVQGEIIFKSGRTASVNGTVIREETDRTCVGLHCGIDPALLMAEQREQIESSKNMGPRPAVSRDALAKPAGSLPSYHPKGICRLK